MGYKWYWWVVWQIMATGESGQSESAPMDTQLQAQTNLEARMSEHPPNVGIPKEAWIVSMGVDMRRGI